MMLQDRIGLRSDLLPRGTELDEIQGLIAWTFTPHRFGLLLRTQMT